MATQQQRKEERQKVGRLSAQVVQDQTRRRYHQSYASFLAFHQLAFHFQLPPAEELDQLVAEYIESLWDDGAPKAQASYALAAIQFFRPPTKHQLVWSWKLVKTWHQIELPTRATPLTPDLLMSLAGQCFLWNQSRMGWLLVLGFGALLRTGELVTIQRQHVILPGQQSEAVLLLDQTKGTKKTLLPLDKVVITEKVVIHALQILTKGLQPRDSLSRMSNGQFRRLWSQLLTHLNLQDCGYMPYSLRRGGATSNYKAGMSLDALVTKGRWQHVATARLYLDQGLQSLSAATQPAASLSRHWEQRRNGTPAPWGPGLRPRREERKVKIEKPKETAEPSGDETDAKAEAAKSATKKVALPDSIGFKTVLCRYFGTPQGCSKGAECRFAHGAEELPAGSAASAQALEEVQQPAAPAFKTVLCKYFEQGHCSRGDECTYAHGIEELQTREAGTYKTVLCKFFEAGGCSRGASCTFAHGEEELITDAGAPSEFGWGSASHCLWHDVPGRCHCAEPELPVQTALLGEDCTYFHDTSAEVQTSADFAVAADTPVPEPEPVVPARVPKLVLPPRRLTVPPRVKEKEEEETVPVNEEVTAEWSEMPEEVTADWSEMQEVTAEWSEMPRFKTALCKFWQEGTCTNGENCTYAHGPEELQPLYKAKLCNFFQQGHCARGANCTFAHGVEELQAGKVRGKWLNLRGCSFEDVLRKLLF
eukprot:Skav219265  [mRNA]  locus=scaffold1380:77928:89294:- [translate_table: standard]